MTIQLCEDLADLLPPDPSPKEVMQRVLWLARRHVWCDSAAIFRRLQGRVVATEYRSPYELELQEMQHLGRAEPLVWQAFDSGRTTRLKAADRDGPRLFQEEKFGVAVPLRDQAVLYLGRREGDDFSESEVEGLRLLCGQAYFALTAAQLSATRAATLNSEAASRRRTESLLEGMSAVVDVMTEVLALDEPLAVLRTAGKRLNKVVEHLFWAILLEPREGGPKEEEIYLWGGEQPRRDVLGQLAEPTLAAARPLSYVALTAKGWPLPSPGSNALLVCPMWWEPPCRGCLILGSTRKAFSRRDQELAGTLAFQLGSHFWNLHLRHQLRRSQAQLVQSSKMAAVGQLAAGVAHELNTPLGVLTLAVEGALRSLRQQAPERCETKLTRALTAAEQLKVIVRQLLAYARQDADTEPTEVDLSTVVRESWNLLGRQLQLDGIECTLETPALALVRAHRSPLQQIVLNLLTNARDAVLEGGPERRIHLTTSCRDGKVLLIVEDSGVGMDEEVLARLFDPFFTTKDVGRGTGLGLSVSRELVEQMGGRIEVESRPGQGATFRVSFPTSST